MKSTVFSSIILITSTVLGHAQTSTGNSGSFLKSLARPGNTDVDFETDGLFSSDIKVIQSLFSFETTQGDLTIDGSVGYTRHEVEVSAPPAFGVVPNTAREDTYRYSLGLDYAVTSNFDIGFSLSHTDGFADHRSIWISETNTPLQGVDGFPTANPQSTSFTLNTRWGIVPGRDTLSTSFTFSQARIVPRASVGPPTFTTITDVEEVRDTYSTNIRWERTWSPTLNTQTSLRLTRTESRDLRGQLQFDAALRLANNLVLRGQIGAAKENPTFESIYGGLTLVWTLSENWQLDLGARYYEDTGEINTENSNTAAPGVETNEFSLGLLWAQNGTSVRMSAGIYDTDFDPITNPANGPFLNLYRDRDFVTARFALSHEF